MYSENKRKSYPEFRPHSQSPLTQIGGSAGGTGCAAASPRGGCGSDCEGGADEEGGAGSGPPGGTPGGEGPAPNAPASTTASLSVSDVEEEREVVEEE